jgi:hypothetical protein
MIEDITEGSEWNDVLYYLVGCILSVSPTLHDLKDKLASKRPLVSNPNGGKDILRAIASVEMDRDAFFESIRLIMDTPTYMGLDRLVIDNPNTTRRFLLSLLNDESIPMAGRLLQFVSEMAISFQNHHHRSDLAEAVIAKAGKLSLLRDAPPAADGVNVLIHAGPTAITTLTDEAKAVKELLLQKDFISAQERYDALLPKMELLYSGLKVQSFGGPCEPEDALLFGGVVAAVRGDQNTAWSRFISASHMGYKYGDLLLFNVDLLSSESARTQAAFGQIMKRDGDGEGFSFDDFVHAATNFRYADVNSEYKAFLELVGDRAMEEA